MLDDLAVRAGVGRPAARAGSQDYCLPGLFKGSCEYGGGSLDIDGVEAEVVRVLRYQTEITDEH